MACRTFKRKNLKEQRRQKEEQEKISREFSKVFRIFANNKIVFLKNLITPIFRLNAMSRYKKPLENPTNNILNSNHQNTQPQNNTKMFDYFDNPMFRY